MHTQMFREGLEHSKSVIVMTREEEGELCRRADVRRKFPFLFKKALN